MTMDPSAHHPDPIGEAFSHSSQKAAQFISMVGAAYEIAARRKAIRAARDAARTEQQRRALQEQERAARVRPPGHGGARLRRAVAGPGRPAPGRPCLGRRRPVRRHRPRGGLGAAQDPALRVEASRGMPGGVRDSDGGWVRCPGHFTRRTARSA